MKFDFHKFLAVVNLVAPVVLAAVPGGEKIASMIPVIVAGIGEAEKIKGASGEEKKKHVLATVSAGVAAANNSGAVKLDPLEVERIASNGIDTVISTIHVIEGAKVVKQPVKE
jgi:hypothetical protein